MKIIRTLFLFLTLITSGCGILMDAILIPFNSEEEESEEKDQ